MSAAVVPGAASPATYCRQRCALRRYSRPLCSSSAASSTPRRSSACSAATWPSMSPSPVAAQRAKSGEVAE
jgi:hypothetical protein